MVRECKTCGVTQAITEFPLTGKKDYRKHTCKGCFTEQARNKMLRYKYGISLGDFNKMLSEQDHKCLICKREASEWCVDHDHSCCPTKSKSCGECVRGILCHDCNRALGLFHDDPDALLEAYAYLMGSKVKAGVVA